MKYYVTMLAAFGLLVLSSCCTPSTMDTFTDWNEDADYTLVWSDEFDGSVLDSNNWNIEVNNFGGYNNELQYYTDRADNVRIENGKLVIEGKKEDYLNRNYTSARINSKGKQYWKYGRMEARIKLPYGKGMWPAFWMMGEKGNWPNCGEIDIMEMVGGYEVDHPDYGDNLTHGYMWYYDDTKKDTNGSGTDSPPLASGIYADDFHTFAIEWTPFEIIWLIDDTEFYRASITAKTQTEYHQPFYFLLNLAIGGDWPGDPDDSVLPQKMYVDYVRVYQKI